MEGDDWVVFDPRIISKTVNKFVERILDFLFFKKLTDCSSFLFMAVECLRRAGAETSSSNRIVSPVLALFSSVISGSNSSVFCLFLDYFSGWAKILYYRWKKLPRMSSWFIIESFNKVDSVIGTLVVVVLSMSDFLSKNGLWISSLSLTYLASLG